MNSIRKAALVAGVLYLVTFISSIPAALLLGPAQIDPVSTLMTIPNSQIRLAAVLELVKREHEGLARGFVATRMFEGAALVGGSVALRTLAALREAGAASDGVTS